MSRRFVDRVHGLQAVRLVQRRQPSVGAEHRLQLVRGRFGHERDQRERHLDELVRLALRQIGRLDPRHQAGIELLDVGNRQYFAVAKQREAAGQQVPVDQVADFRHLVAPLRGKIERVAGQFLPVETHVRNRGQPFQHGLPGLAIEIEADFARRVGPDLELVAVRRSGRRRGAMDRLGRLLRLRVVRLAGRPARWPARRSARRAAHHQGSHRGFIGLATRPRTAIGMPGAAIPAVPPVLAGLYALGEAASVSMVIAGELY